MLDFGRRVQIFVMAKRIGSGRAEMFVEGKPRREVAVPPPRVKAAKPSDIRKRVGALSRERVLAVRNGRARFRGAQRRLGAADLMRLSWRHGRICEPKFR
jgi:hypothetical protein